MRREKRGTNKRDEKARKRMREIQKKKERLHRGKRK